MLVIIAVVKDCNIWAVKKIFRTKRSLSSINVLTWHKLEQFFNAEECEVSAEGRGGFLQLSS